MIAPRRRTAAHLGAAVALLVALVVPATPAGAQVPPDPVADPRVELVGQDPWTPLGGDVRLRLRLSDPPAEASVSLAAYPAVPSRSAYDAMMLLGVPIDESVIGQVSVPVAEIPTENGAYVVTLGLQSPTGPRDPARLGIRRPGVYPLKVDLRDGDENTRSSFRTVIVVDDPDRPTITERLRVAWVWPIAAPPSYLPDGHADRDAVDDFRADGRLGRMAAALEAVPDVPVTLAPTAETTEAWAELARTDATVQSTYESILTAAAANTVLDGFYVPTDVAALLASGNSLAVDDGLARGSELLQAAFGGTMDVRTRVLRPATPQSLGRMRAAGVDRVVVPAENVAPAAETRFTLAQPVTLRAPLGGSTEPVTALVTDPGLQGLLTAELPEAQRVQLVLGGLALVALETPSVTRVATLLNPELFAPSANLYAGLLAGLRDNPFLVPVSATEAFDTVPVDPPAPTVDPSAATSDRELAPVPLTEPPVSAESYRTQRTRLISFNALTQPGDPAAAAAQASLLASVSSAWTPDIARARGAAHLRVVDRAIDGLVSLIEVPDPRTITLTSRSGEIPLTFRNDTGFPVRLRAALASEKLFFPEGSVRELVLPPRSTTVRVAVEARTSGTFPLDLEVTSADGVLSISQRRLEVRSTFVSTVGVVLMVSAVAFLAVWWGLDLRRRRVRRRQTPAA